MKPITLAAVFAVAGAFAFHSTDSQTATPPSAQDSRQDVDALGTVYVSSGNQRGSGFFEAAGNPGFWIRIRNWDTARPIHSITGLVGFSPNTAARVVKARTRKASMDGRENPRGSLEEATVDGRGMIQIANLTLEPAEAVDLYVTLSAIPKDPYGFLFKAEY